VDTLPCLETWRRITSRVVGCLAFPDINLLPSERLIRASGNHPSRSPRTRKRKDVDRYLLNGRFPLSVALRALSSPQRTPPQSGCRVVSCPKNDFYIPSPSTTRPDMSEEYEKKSIDHTEEVPQEGELQRGLKNRHAQMIS